MQTLDSCELLPQDFMDRSSTTRVNAAASLKKIDRLSHPLPLSNGGLTAKALSKEVDSPAVSAPRFGMADLLASSISDALKVLRDLSNRTCRTFLAGTS